MNRALALSALLFVTGLAMLIGPSLMVDAQPGPAGVMTVTDGDTIRHDGITYRLVGYDAPELRGRCASERTLARAAKARLADLIATRPHQLTAVPCNCRPGTEGTPACNRGRRCAVLTVDGADVAQTMISEGLARAYICKGTSCPKRGSWC